MSAPLIGRSGSSAFRLLRAKIISSLRECRSAGNASTVKTFTLLPINSRLSCCWHSLRSALQFDDYGHALGPTAQSVQIPALVRQAKASGIARYIGRGLNRSGTLCTSSAGTGICGTPVQTRMRSGIVPASLPGNSGTHRIVRRVSSVASKDGAAVAFCAGANFGDTSTVQIG
jgi:hypothetical protein